MSCASSSASNYIISMKTFNCRSKMPFWLMKFTALQKHPSSWLVMQFKPNMEIIRKMYILQDFWPMTVSFPNVLWLNIASAEKSGRNALGMKNMPLKSRTGPPIFNFTKKNNKIFNIKRRNFQFHGKNNVFFNFTKKK